MKHLTHVPSRTRPRPHACSCPSDVRCRVTRGTAAAGGVFSPSCFVLRDVRDLLVLEVEPRCRRVERTAFVNAKVVEEGPRLVGCARQRLVVDVDAARPRMQLPPSRAFSSRKARVWFLPACSCVPASTLSAFASGSKRTYSCPGYDSSQRWLWSVEVHLEAEQLPNARLRRVMLWALRCCLHSFFEMSSSPLCVTEHTTRSSPLQK